MTKPARSHAGPAAGLSPTCVVHLGPDGRRVRIVDGVRGEEYDLSRKDFVCLLASDDPALQRALPPALRASAARRNQFAEAGLVGASDNPSLLSAVELAFHRQLNHAGYDARGAVGPAEAPPGADAIALPVIDDFGAPIDLVDCFALRCSKRAYSAAPMPLAAFAGLLQLACRTRAVVEHADGETLPLHSYPSGGGRYSLEIYPIVYRVAGLAPGPYRYDPRAHALVPRPAADPALGERLQALAADSMWSRMTGAPQVLIVVASVFARCSSRYRNTAYHLILAELGALYQTLHLAAARLGLAACALGQVKERMVGRWLGLAAPGEAQVGWLALGVPEPVQDAFAARGLELLSDPPIASRDVVRLDAGALAFAIPLAELLFDLDGDGLVIGWASRSLRFVLASLPSRTILAALALVDDTVRWTTVGRTVSLRGSARLRERLARS
jgi:SagB-type dehydrogenase family enzyme